MPKNVRDLDKLIVAKGFNKSPNLVTLVTKPTLKTRSDVLLKTQ